uniref:(+)RNA virus helicase C-terminal domain-containing protein n=1 Tax=Anopheles farauti TaxID=69004 RepID=A0A182QRG4_9DIPT
MYAGMARSIAGGGQGRKSTVAKPGKAVNPRTLQARDQVVAVCSETYRFCCTDEIGVKESVLPPPGLGIVAIRGKPFKVDKRQHLMVIHFRTTDELLNYIQKFFEDMNVRVAVVGGNKGGGLEWYWSQTNAYKQYWDKADSEYEVDFSIPPSRETFCRNAVRECREQWYISLKNVGQKYGTFYKWHVENIASIPPENVRGIKKLCQDSGEDFGIIKDGKFIVRPMDIEFYEKAFNGRKFIDLQYKDNDPMSPSERHAGYLLVGKSSRLMQGASMLEATKDFDPYGTYIPPITLRNGVPGCGKTKYIIDNADTSDYILTTTRENKQDIATRCPVMQSRVRTVHSVIVNNRTLKNVSVKRLFIDEALMSHAGELLIAITILRPEFVEMSGDVNQIPFINRAAAIIMKFDDASRICDSVTHASMSYRVPKDVAALFSPSYEQGFTTNNHIDNSLKWVEVSGFQDLPKEDPVLVFKQAEKTMLRLEGYDVSTVHEYQGKQSERISLYRHSTIPSDQIYSSDPHILVALSRHTQSLIYYTRLKDKVCEVISRATEALEKVNHRSMSGGGPSCVMMMNTKYDGPNYSKILPFGLAYDVPRYRLFKSIASVLRPRYTKIRLNHVTPQVQALQQWYDAILPEVSTVDRTYDNHMIHDDPLSVSIAGSVTLDLSKMRPEGRKFDNMRPVLRTSMGLERIRSQRESLLAYIKRNDAVPIPIEPIDPKYVVDMMMEKFQGYFDPEKLSGVLGTPLTLSSESMHKWAMAQDKSIDMSVEQYLNENDLGKYEFMRYTHGGRSVVQAFS